MQNFRRVTSKPKGCLAGGILIPGVVTLNELAGTAACGQHPVEMVIGQLTPKVRVVQRIKRITTSPPTGHDGFSLLERGYGDEIAHAGCAYSAINLYTLPVDPIGPSSPPFSFTNT